MGAITFSAPDRLAAPMTQKTETFSKQVKSQRRILQFDELPSWMQIDPHIRHGYRNELKSVSNCISSLFYTHNEFVNVWSHLLPAIVHLLLLAREYGLARHDNGPTSPWTDRAMIQLYVFSAVICLLSSSAYHILNAHSEHVSRKFLKLDYLGIVVNTAVTCVTSTWFGLRQKPYERGIYITCSLGLSLLVFHLLLRPGADGGAAALWRSLLFAAFVGSGYVPMVHNYVLHGAAGLRYFPVDAALGMAAFYLYGTVYYVTRFPERYFPEVFDIWGSSHQIFHVLVMLGQIVYLCGLRDLAAHI